MSEYRIRSNYFSSRNKFFLLICIIFFTASTHIFKNVFPFLFMITNVKDHLKNSSLKSNDSNIFSNRKYNKSTLSSENKVKTSLNKNDKISYITLSNNINTLDNDFFLNKHKNLILKKNDKSNKNNNKNKNDKIDNKLDKNNKIDNNKIDKNNNLYIYDNLNENNNIYIYDNLDENNNIILNKENISKNNEEKNNLNNNYDNIINYSNININENNINNIEKSIYSYNNILLLIYLSSLLTYLFILVKFNKNSYFLKYIYIINLLCHCFVFIILDNIKLHNQIGYLLNNENYLINLSTDTIKLNEVNEKDILHLNSNSFNNITENDLINEYLNDKSNIFKNNEINNFIYIFFKFYLSSNIFVSYIPITLLLEKWKLLKNLQFYKQNNTTKKKCETIKDETMYNDKMNDIKEKEQINYVINEDKKEIDNKNKLKNDVNINIESEIKDKKIDTINNFIRNKDTKNNIYLENEEFIYENYNKDFPNNYEDNRKDNLNILLYLLYFFIIISSICSSYINIYQKQILYCIFYINMGSITSCLMLLNSILKLSAHCLNYLFINTLKSRISTYTFLFLFIDLVGLMIVYFFNYLWTKQQTLWINLHNIFYNYQYVCFYTKRTYYIYSNDKNIDNILVNIDLCYDKNIDIKFCAYINLNKSIFYEYYILNKFKFNKLKIIEIKDKNFQIKSTYKSRNISIKHKGKNVENNTKDEYNRRKNQSLTIKPYKIYIKELNKKIMEKTKMEDETNTEYIQIDDKNNICDSDEIILDDNTQINIVEYDINKNDINAYNNKTNSKFSVENKLENNKINMIEQKSNFSINNNCNLQDNFLQNNYLSLNNKKNTKLDKNNNIYNENISFSYSLENMNQNNLTLKENIENKEIQNIHFINDNNNEIENNINEYINNEDNKNESDVYEKKDSEKKKNILLIPEYNDTSNKNEEEFTSYYDYYENIEDTSLNKNNKKKKNLKIFQKIKLNLSSCTVFFYFYTFIYSFLLSIIHIFVNYFFYIYLFVYNINIYVSNVYTIIMTSTSLISILYSGYIIDRIGAFFALILCSSFFILITILGTIYSYKNNLNSEVLAFIFFNLIGISESIIPTAIISQIPTHLCVKSNEYISFAFAMFELISLITISINNYIFGIFLRNKNYLKGLYILFVLIIFVIILILLLIVKIYFEKQKYKKGYLNKNANLYELTQPLL